MSYQLSYPTLFLPFLFYPLKLQNSSNPLSLKLANTKTHQITKLLYQIRTTLILNPKDHSVTFTIILNSLRTYIHVNPKLSCTNLINPNVNHQVYFNLLKPNPKASRTTNPNTFLSKNLNKIPRSKHSSCQESTFPPATLSSGNQSKVQLNNR